MVRKPVGNRVKLPICQGKIVVLVGIVTIIVDVEFSFAMLSIGPISN